MPFDCSPTRNAGSLNFLALYKRFIKNYEESTIVSVVVQRLGYLAFTQETRVRFPATEPFCFFGIFFPFANYLQVIFHLFGFFTILNF
jgi:hypothetical protein